MISSLRRVVTRTLTMLLERKKFTFYGGSYTVSEGVLNPTLFRASLVFAAEALNAAGSQSIDILELGSGTGLASVALARRDHRVTAVDRSFEAAFNTAVNAKNNGVIVRSVCSDWDTALAPDLTFDLVVMNPPFLPSPTPVFNDALWGGPDLIVVQAALKAAARRIRPDGRVLLLTSDHSGRTDVLRAVRASGLAPVTNRVVRHWGEELHFDLLTRLPWDSQR
ncbi:MAG: class I SAM-dependent methyltransferase [Acidobacteria bacterium]|nr:class I SAM-dependent methyltransferase [Acidobacteriota bacterium]